MSAASEYDPDLRWNFTMGVINGIIFRLRATLIDPNLVLVVFLAHLTDNPILLGMVSPLWYGGLRLPQLWVGNRVQGLQRSLPVYKRVSLVRACVWLALVLLTALLDSPAALIVMFFAFLLVYSILWGMAALAFMDIVGKTIPPRLRGTYFSWRMALGGVLALGGGALIRPILSPDFALGFPRNFALIFALAAISTIIGVQFFHAVREPATTARTDQTRLHGPREQGRAIRRILRENLSYRRYLLARIALFLAANTASLIIIHAQSRFNLALENAPLFLIVDTATDLIAVALGGWLSLRLGDRSLALVSAGLGLVTFLLVLLASLLDLSVNLALPYFIAIFATLAAHRGTSSVSMMALNLNIAPPDERPLYVGLGNTILGVMFYFSAAQGILVSIAGYEGLFALAAVLMAFSLWELTRVHDPTTEAVPAKG